MAGMRRQSRGIRRRCVEVKGTLPVMDRFWNLNLYLRNYSDAGDLWLHGVCGSGVSALFGCLLQSCSRSVTLAETCCQALPWKDPFPNLCHRQNPFGSWGTKNSSFFLCITWRSLKFLETSHACHVCFPTWLLPFLKTGVKRQNPAYTAGWMQPSLEHDPCNYGPAQAQHSDIFI